MKPDEFIAAARLMLGVRFRHQGRDPVLGVDCAGLAVCAAKRCGYEAQDYTDYKRTPKASDFIAVLLRQCDRVRPGDETPGDLWVFQFENSPQHLAIQTGPRSIIHARADLRKVVEHDLDSEWLSRRVCVFRLKEL